MIILYLKKSNTNFKEIIQTYVNTLNFCHLQCPNCHSHHLIRWGYYERNVIFFSNNRIAIENTILKIQRVMCKSCGKTHALLPFGIIPYKQFTDEIISKILFELTYNTLVHVFNKYQIDLSIIKNWYIQYYKFHSSKVNILIKYHDSKQTLKKFINNFVNKLDYINHYNLCFMQIKLGCLGLCPS